MCVCCVVLCLFKAFSAKTNEIGIQVHDECAPQTRTKNWLFMQHCKRIMHDVRTDRVTESYEAQQEKANRFNVILYLHISTVCDYLLQSAFDE